MVHCLGGVVLLLAVLAQAWAVKLSIPAGATECISETVVPEQVPGTGPINLSIDGAVQVLAMSNRMNYNSRRNVDVTVTNPETHVLYNRHKVWQEVKFSVQDVTLGTYSLCLSNNGHARIETRVDVPFFTITHVDPAAPAGPNKPVVIPKGSEEVRATELASHLHLTQVHDLVNRVREHLALVRGEQRYYRKRMDRHMQTNEDTHWRAFMYTALEVTVLVALAITQVTTIHMMFARHRANKGILGV